MLHYKPNKELLEEYSEKVFGHENAKRALINLVNRSKIRHHQKYGMSEHKDSLIKPAKILLIGDSGTGKTHLVNTLVEMVEFPVLYLDATQLAPTSATGISGQKVWSMIQANAEDYVRHRAAEGYTHSVDGVIDQTVIFIDEIDKLAKPFDSGSGGWNKHTQSNFLTLFDDDGNLSGVSFILAGAFTGLEEQLKGTTSKNGIGFSAQQSEYKEVDLGEEVVKYGLLPELVGRLNSIIRLDKFTKEEYIKILDTMILPQKQHELMHFNASYLDLTDAQKTEIIDKAVKSGQGVRFLQREINKLCSDIEFDYEEIDPDRLLLTNFTDRWGEL